MKMKYIEPTVTYLPLAVEDVLAASDPILEKPDGGSSTDFGSLPIDLF